jgi:hypothetical protein
MSGQSEAVGRTAFRQGSQSGPAIIIGRVKVLQIIMTIRMCHYDVKIVSACPDRA